MDPEVLCGSLTEHFHNEQCFVTVKKMHLGKELPGVENIRISQGQAFLYLATAKALS